MRNFTSCGRHHRSLLWASALLVLTVAATNVAPGTSGARPPLPSGRIAFTSYADGRLDVEVIGPDGSERRSITVDGKSSLPRWSHDGSRIAYESTRSGTSQIYVRTVATGAETMLTDRYRNSTPAWFADDRSLVFASDRAHYPNGGSDLYRVWLGRGGGSVKRLTTSDWYVYRTAPDVSPDGRTVMLQHYDSSAGEYAIHSVERLALATGDVTRYVSGESPRLSPNGRALAYVSELDDPTSGGPVDVIVARSDGSAPRSVLRGIGLTGLSWSPDGRWIAMCANYELMIIPSAGGRLRRVGTATCLSTDWTT